MRFIVACILIVTSAVACMPSRGVRLERTVASSDRRPSGDSLVEIDPRTGVIVHVIRIADPGPVAVSGSSVWVVSPRRRWSLESTRTPSKSLQRRTSPIRPSGSLPDGRNRSGCSFLGVLPRLSDSARNRARS